MSGCLSKAFDMLELESTCNAGLCVEWPVVDASMLNVRKYTVLVFLDLSFRICLMPFFIFLSYNFCPCASHFAAS